MKLSFFPKVARESDVLYQEEKVMMLVTMACLSE
jgi:hypothetical protein